MLWKTVSRTPPFLLTGADDRFWGQFCRWGYSSMSSSLAISVARGDLALVAKQLAQLDEQKRKQALSTVDGEGNSV